MDPAHDRRDAEYVDKIRQALRDKKLVIIVGAGISLLATHPSPPRITWTGLIRGGLDYLQRGFVPGDDEDLNHYQRVLQRENTNIGDVLRVCHYLKDKLDQNKQFATWLESVFLYLHRHVTHPEVFEVFHRFHRRGARLMTTNYDELLEHHCHLQRVRRSIPEDVRKYEQGTLDGVFHIHGSFQDPKEVVLDPIGYYQVKTSNDVQNLLKTYLGHNTILFVGCGSGLEDPNFKALLEWTSSREENIPNHHYLLVRDGDNLRYNPLITLRYGRNYDDLVPYLYAVLEDPADAFAADTLRIRKASAERPLGFRLGLHLSDAPDVESRLFIGREPELMAMETLFKPNEISGEQRILVLGGMGGIGKTQLAIAFAKRHRHSYESIFWLNATSPQTLEASLHRLAQRILTPEELKHCENDQQVMHVSRWLSETENTRWLLIFDNYDEPDQYEITKYYPYVSQGSILVTTRLPDHVSGTKVKIQHLDQLEDGLQILETRSERKNVKSDVDARRLAERLHGLPLALATAGAFLKRNTVSFKRYLDEYEKLWDITPQRPTILTEYEARTLYTTWGLSFTRLEREDPDAAQLLAFLAYFDNESIWYELLHAGISKVSAEWLIAVAKNDMVFASAMSKLVEYCFVECHSRTESYNMHACVHDWTLHGLNRDIDVAKYWFAFDCVAGSIGDEDWESLSTLKFQRLAAHAARLIHDRFSGVWNLENTFDKRISQALDIAKMLRAQIQYNAAEQVYRRALQGYERMFGPEHISTLNTVHNIGSLYDNQGKLDEAEKMYDRALQGYERMFSPEHISTLNTVHNIGSLYDNQGKLDEAEKMYDRALQGYEKALGPEHISTLNTVHNIGSLYDNQGKLDEAEKMYDRALQGYEKALGPEHISTLDTVNNLGVLYENQGKLDEAEKMYDRALQGYEKTLGPERSYTYVPALNTITNIARLYALLGRADEAEDMYSRALGGNEVVFGRSSDRYQGIIAELAVLRGDTDNS